LLIVYRHHATEDLILAGHRIYYRTTVETRHENPKENTHWQLRSLIASPEQNVIYFPSGWDISALNTKTNEREVIATLPFTVRCLTASKDWLCCGGEDGNYTAIPLTDRGTNADSNQEGDADARLPLDLDPSRRSNVRETSFGSRISRRFNRPVTPNIVQIGTKDRITEEMRYVLINCITLWSPSEHTSEKSYKTSVAVVSQNDSTVSILNIETSEILDKLTFPDLVNRSVISPDGGLLATITDDPYLYIHERKAKLDLHPIPFDGRKETTRYEWVRVGRIQLEGQFEKDDHKLKGSFAACFSKLGQYLAVASQYGIISVFDTRYLPSPEALVVNFTGSRPGRDEGAIRDMEFSPAPFDLLAWTETNGRVGVADVRSLFMYRQRVLISHSDGVERVLVSDRLSEPVIDPRPRGFRTDPPSSNTTPDYLGLGLVLERRQLRHLTREMSDRHQAPLTAEE
jgi:WD40 repeat protein